MTVRSKHFLLAAFCIIPVVVFFRAVFAMSVNIPFQDDFDGLLEPVLLLHTQKPSFSGFWQILYAQDDERRIVVDRLIAYLVFKLSGELNLRAMVIAGAFNLLVFAGVLLRWFKSTGTPWILFAPIPWLLFNIQFYETVFWPMIPFQHLAVFIWAMLTIWLLSRDSPAAFIAALVSAMFTLYADVSGNFILAAGLFVLVARQRWQAAALWLVIVGIAVGYYFSGLVIPEYRPKFSDNFSRPVLLLSVLTALFGIWSDPGPTFPMLLRESIAIITGLVCMVFVAVLLVQALKPVLKNRKPVEKNDIFLWGAVCFIAIVLAVLASGRTSEGLDSIFKPRYRHMYIFWLIFVYLLAVRYRPLWFKSRAVKTGTILYAVLFCVNAYVMYWGGLDRYRKTFFADAYQWYYNRSLPSSPIYLALRKRVDDIYEGVYKEGIYRPEKYPFAALPQAPVKGTAEIELTASDGGVEVSVRDQPRKPGKDDGTYIIFRAQSGETHILPAYHTQRPLHRLILDRSYYYPDSQTERYATAYFRSAVFDVEVGVIEGENQYRLLTGKQLRL